MTHERFADIIAQEMHTNVGADLDLTALRPGVRVTLGPGRYQTLVHLGELEGRPMVSFTCPWRASEVEHTAPSLAYLHMIRSGLAELTPAQSTSAE